MTVDQPFEDHNGGHIAFGPDGLLYWGLGDGGNVNEPNTRSQDPSLLLGKLIRLDVDGGAYTAPADNLYATEPEFMPEIWALGLRNPWRFSFDRATGDLYIGDVGQWEWEEINFLPAGSPAGANFGWSVYEGFEEYALVTYELAESAVTMPFVTYDHLTGCSVTGGYTYRGQALPELNGYYFYADYCFGRIWTAWRDDSRVWQTSLWMETGRQITSFGEDERGELYLVDYKGEILRLDRGT
jgi:glucose/arabinose dehydrogenase